MLTNCYPVLNNLTCTPDRILTLRPGVGGRIMMMAVIAATRLQDVLAPKERGQRVNAHVVSVPREPKPDFDAMKRVIQGRNQQLAAPDDTTRREVPQID